MQITTSFDWQSTLGEDSFIQTLGHVLNKNGALVRIRIGPYPLSEVMGAPYKYNLLNMLLSFFMDNSYSHLRTRTSLVKEYNDLLGLSRLKQYARTATVNHKYFSL